MLALGVALSLAALALAASPQQRASAAAGDVPALDWLQPAPDTGSIALSADGTTVYAAGTDQYYGIGEYSAATGQPIGELWVTQFAGAQLFTSPAGLFALDCDAIDFTYNDPGMGGAQTTTNGCNYSLWKVNTATAGATKLAEIPGQSRAYPSNYLASAPVVSADGKHVFVALDDFLDVVDLTTGALTAKAEQGDAVRGAATGANMWVERTNASTLLSSLDQVSPTGATVSSLALPAGVQSAFIEPDGSSAVITAMDSAQKAAGITQLSTLNLKTGAVQDVAQLPTTNDAAYDEVLSGDGMQFYIDNESSVIEVDLASGTVTSGPVSASPSVTIGRFGGQFPGLIPDAGSGFFSLPQWSTGTASADYHGTALVHYGPHPTDAPSPVMATAMPTLTNAVAGQTATVSVASWATPPDTVSYQWYSNFRPIPGATGATLAITPQLGGTWMDVVITAIEAGYATTSITTPVQQVALMTLTSPVPTISGKATPGATLTANPGTWTQGTTLTYQWDENGNPMPISGATSRTFVVPYALQGDTISVTVTGTQKYYYDASETSKSTAKVPFVTYHPAVKPALAGPDRYATAIAISKDSYPTAGSATTVVITSGENFPDALSAAPAAVKLGGPLLLTPHDHLPADVAAEVKRLAPQRIVVAGGTSAVSAAVVSSLSKIAPTTRVSGSDRYATSLALAKFAFGSTKVPEVFFATGASFPDALSASAVGGSQGAPVVLFPPGATSIPASMRAWLVSARTGSFVVVGGFAALPWDVQHSLASLKGAAAVDRFAGADRFDTNRQLNYAMGPQIQKFATTAYLASGANFPDALAGAAAAWHAQLPLYLVEPNCVPGATITTMKSDGFGIDTVKPLGGPSAVGAGATRMTACG